MSRVYVDVDPMDFIESCNSHELEFIVNYLDGCGALDVMVRSEIRSTGDHVFETALNQLHGKRYQLTKEEENQIIEISKRVS